MIRYIRLAPKTKFDLSQLGMEAVLTGTGEKEMKPNEKTAAFLDKANIIFQNTEIGPFYNTTQETDKKYEAAVAALTAATEFLPNEKKYTPWFAKGHPGIQEVHQKLVNCMNDLTKPGLSTQQKYILRKRKYALRRRRQAMINGAKKDFFKEMEKLIEIEGSNGPVSTSGRREWAVRKKIMNAFQSRKHQRTQIIKIVDSETKKIAADQNDRKRILEKYADKLYQTNGMDVEMLDRIEEAHTPESVPDTIPDDDEIFKAIEKVKSRMVRTETPAELWKAILMDKSKCTEMRNALTRLIKEQYQGISKSECISNVTAKILNKPGKHKSGLMKDKRIIVLQPFCTCVLEIICRERLEKICQQHIDKYLFQYGHTRKKGTQEALFVHRRWLECRKAVGIDTYVLNLDVIKAFDKMSPKMIFPLIRKLGAPPGLVAAIEHLYTTRTLIFKKSSAKVGNTPNRTLLMQGGALGPTMYKCLKLGVLLSLEKEKVWTTYELGAQPWHLSNDLSHTLCNINPQTYTWSNEITLAMIVFADDVQYYILIRDANWKLVPQNL